MTGKSYELPDDITTLGGMVTWADDVAYMARLVELDRRQALDPVSYDVMEIDPAPGEWPFGRGRE